MTCAVFPTVSLADSGVSILLGSHIPFSHSQFPYSYRVESVPSRSRTNLQTKQSLLDVEVLLDSRRDTYGTHLSPPYTFAPHSKHYCEVLLSSV